MRLRNPISGLISLSSSKWNIRAFGPFLMLLFVSAPCWGDEPAQRSPSTPGPAHPPKKAWLAHAGSNAFVPLAKDEPTFARMTSAYHDNNADVVTALMDAQDIISVPLGTVVNVIKNTDHSALVAIPSGIYTGTKWYVSPFFLRTEAQARALMNPPKTSTRRSRPDFTEVDTAMTQMNSQLQAQLRFERAAAEAMTAPRPAPTAYRFGLPYTPPPAGTPVILEHYCFFGQGTKSACRNLIRDPNQPYCHLHGWTIE